MTASRKIIVEKNATAHPKLVRKSAIPDVGKVSPFSIVMQVGMKSSRECDEGADVFSAFQCVQ